VQLQLRDGGLSAVRSWDGVSGRWRLSRTFYCESQDSCIATFPVRTLLVRVNGSAGEDASVFKSTATALARLAAGRRRR
jgi:hypothetical protein